MINTSQTIEQRIEALEKWRWEQTRIKPMEKWVDITSRVSKNHAPLAALFEQGELAGMDGDEIRLGFPVDSFSLSRAKEKKEEFARHVLETTGKKIDLQIVALPNGDCVSFSAASYKRDKADIAPAIIPAIDPTEKLRNELNTWIKRAVIAERELREIKQAVGKIGNPKKSKSTERAARRIEKTEQMLEQMDEDYYARASE